MRPHLSTEGKAWINYLMKRQQSEGKTIPKKEIPKIEPTAPYDEDNEIDE